MQILQNHYVLAVSNVRDSARFYVDQLGFQIAADHTDWIFVSRDTCTVMLGECPDDLPARELGSHSYFAYLRVDDVDAFHAELRARKVEPLSALADEPWGMREFSIQTPDGHRIRFGAPIAPVAQRASRGRRASSRGAPASRTTSTSAPPSPGAGPKFSATPCEEF